MIERLFRAEQTPGLMALGAMALALALVNSPLAEFYELVHHAPVTVRVGALVIDKPSILWINDGLMVFFFLLVGLDIKREMLEGQLTTAAQIALPGFAAVGGMLVPALVYALFNAGSPDNLRGWAIPTATDIVLALAVLSLLGTRVPVSLKVFLTALAIFDDLGAIIIIALFYSAGLSAVSLALALLGVAALVALNRLQVTRTAPYVVVGVFLWVAVLKSGVHATLAGVIIGWSIPMRVPGKGSPLRAMEHGLHPWVALGVVPLFAFFNAGIDLSGITRETLADPMALGVVFGLFFGKQIGIFGAVWVAVNLGVAALPKSVRWAQVYGVALLAGIGFTMSLFIASLAFTQPGTILATNLSVVLGSLLSAVAGVTVLYSVRPRPRPAAASTAIT